MIVLNPNNTLHTFKIVPRQLIPDGSTATIYNKFTEVETTQVPIFTPIGTGAGNLRISLTATEGQDFSLKIAKDGIVYYRDNMFVTAQTPQDYETDNNLYTYSSI